MNYNKIYNNIIEYRKIFEPIDTYTEKHHIIPKSLGGSNNKSNIVKLTAREHFICHLLLTKIYKKDTREWIKMTKAMECMLYKNSSNQKRYKNSHWYSYLKINFSKAQSLEQSGKGNSNYGLIWICNDTLQKSIKIPKIQITDYLKLGWRLGRVLNWDIFIYKQNISLKRKNDKLIKNERKQKLNIDLYSKYYKLYCKIGYKEFVKQTNWKYSQPFLVSQFKKYVPEFIPQNGKRRGTYKT